MINYAIIENEEISRLNLEYQIRRVRPDWKLRFTAETVEDTVAFFSESAAAGIDLLFLDIELDDGNCFDIFRELAEIGPQGKPVNDIPVIFTTSYNQYAIEAFRLNSVDYLLKPIQDEDLVRAVQKWERIRQEVPEAPADMEKLLKSFMLLMAQARDRVGMSSRFARQPPRTAGASRILIASGNSYYSVELSDVAYFKADDKVVYAVMKDTGRRRVTGFASLGEVTPLLPEEDFFQLSRGIIANISAVKRVSKYFKGRLLVTLGAGVTEEDVTVTAARKPEFLEWYGRS